MPVPKIGALQTLFHHVDLAGEGDFLGFSGVSPADFDSFYEKLYERFGRGTRITYFGASSGILLVKMASGEHERCGSYLVGYILQQAWGMGTDYRMVRVGATKYKGSDGASKQADDGFAPIPQRFHPQSLPTLAFEVAFSQSLDRARAAKN